MLLVNKAYKANYNTLPEVFLRIPYVLCNGFLSVLKKAKKNYKAKDNTLL